MMTLLGGRLWPLVYGLVLPLATLVLLPRGAMNFFVGPSEARMQRPATILRSYKVVSDINYRYAITFVSSEVINPTDEGHRVNFTVILPENAYISSFVMEVGGQLYETNVTERVQPDGHLEEIEAVRLRDSNVFRASVCLAGGGTLARFYLTYEELLQRRLGAYHHVVNLHPGQIAQEMNVEVQIHEGRSITALRVPSLQSGHEIELPSEDENTPLVQVLKKTPSEVLITLNPTPEEQQQWQRQRNPTRVQEKKLAAREGGIHAERGLEGQLVVLYDVARDPYTYRNSGGELVMKDGYFVHFFSPVTLPPFNRHLILVIDVSKSMSGEKLSNLKVTLMELLDSLQKTEYFSIIKFHHKKSVWSPFPKVGDSQKLRVVPATSKYIKKAKRHISKLYPSGGTKLISGLLKGISIARRSQEIKVNHTIFPMIVLVTDGEIDQLTPEEEKKAQKVSEESVAGSLGGHWEIPVFCLGFEPDSDMPLLRAISRRSAGGWARQVYLASDIKLQISELLAEASWPVLGGIRFYYCRSSGGLEVDLSSLTQTRFYSTVSGSELVVAGKLKNYDEELMLDSVSDIDTEYENCSYSNRMIHGIITATSTKGRARFPFRSTIADSSFPIERLWAYLMVNQLTELEAAQRVWGPFWTEKVLNGGFTLSDYPNETYGRNGFDSMSADSEEQSLAKLLAKKYSFVSPGMTLKFAELKEPWEYSYPISSNSYNRRGNHQGKKARLRSGYGGEINDGLERMRFDYDYRGRCNNQEEGLFWQPLPHKLKPSSLCSLGIHNSSCNLEENSEEWKNDKYPLVMSMDEIIWLNDFKSGSNLILPRRYCSNKCYLKLGHGEENREHGKCKAPFGVPGHCRHLHHCILKEIANDFQYFVKHICHIGSKPVFAGVCCPDYLHKNKTYYGS